VWLGETGERRFQKAAAVLGFGIYKGGVHHRYRHRWLERDIHSDTPRAWESKALAKATHSIEVIFCVYE
jgi:hypothetical protein